MKHISTITVLFMGIAVFGQSSSVKRSVKYINNVILANQRNKKCSISDCDTMIDKKGDALYRCWNFYYTDTGRKNICEFTISFSGKAELYYFFEDQKLVKVQRNILSRGKVKHIWRMYLKEDKEIYSSGKSDGAGWNYVDDAAHFRDIGFEYPGEGKCHLQLTGTIHADGKKLEHHILNQLR